MNINYFVLIDNKMFFLRCDVYLILFKCVLCHQRIVENWLKLILIKLSFIWVHPQVSSLIRLELTWETIGMGISFSLKFTYFPAKWRFWLNDFVYSSFFGQKMKFCYKKSSFNSFPKLFSKSIYLIMKQSYIVLE